MSDRQESLNPQQRAAVTHAAGPCLVLAGAGSGKTRVITHRIAWLLQQRQASPGRVCALTFTNKAAAEMRSRLDGLLGGAPPGLWLLTFHALGLRLLRLAAGQPGAPASGFSIAGRSDSIAVWRRCQGDLGIDAGELPPAQLYESCSRAVNRLEDPGAWDIDGRPREQRAAARVWRAYRQAMKRRNALDFDDLLVRALRLLSEPDTRRTSLLPDFAHLLVDEYQDTNRLQYRLLRVLLGKDCSLMVVGDEDQSIYRWRGADIANVLQFQADFAGATVIRLEQNYRSTQPILSAAGSLVAHNHERIGKELWTENGGGDVPVFCLCGSERDEAVWTAKQIAAAIGRGRAPNHFAVLYRTNAQSRPFEEELAARNIPFRVVGGPTFFRRAEIKDLLAYLRLAVSDDPVALGRAAATPRRGVGPGTIAVLEAAGGGVGALLGALEQPDPEAALRDLGCPGRGLAGLLRFAILIGELRARLGRDTIVDLVDHVLHHAGYAAFLRARPDGEERLANLEELTASATEFGADTPASGDVLEAFLDRAALVSDAESAKGAGGGVSLLTIHAAKGLEFDNVFVAGLEEGLFPHAAAVQSGQVEEERRLAYVAMTRARRKLWLSAARLRRVRGRERLQRESRFVREIDPRHLNRTEGPGVVVAAAEMRRQRTRASPLRRQRPAGPATPVSPNARGTGTPAPAARLGPGAGVFHPMFGPGRVTESQGSGDKLKLTVAFPRAGTKQLLARYARLELLDER